MLILVAVLIGLGLVGIAVAIALGWVSDTTQPGRKWYPAGPDVEPDPRLCN